MSLPATTTTPKQVTLEEPDAEEVIAMLLHYVRVLHGDGRRHVETSKRVREITTKMKVQLGWPETR